MTETNRIPQGPDKFLVDRIGAIYEGEEITIWNRLKVQQTHDVHAGEIVEHHKVFAGDGTSAQEPEYITPAMDEQLRELDIYPNAEVVDPRDDEVEIL